MSVSAEQPSMPAGTGDASRDHPPRIARDLEAVLLSAGRAVPVGRLAAALGLVKAPAPDEEPREEPRSAAAVAGLVAQLNAHYEGTGASFRVEHVAGGYRLMTTSAHAGAVAAYQRDRAAHKLSRAAVETLAVIAYRQPVTRAELEAIRGVSCGDVLKSLLDRRLVTIKGRAEELGRPMLYATTRQFLDAFGLASVADLPSIAELKPVPAPPAPAGVPDSGAG